MLECEGDNAASKSVLRFIWVLTGDIQSVCVGSVLEGSVGAASESQNGQG